MNIFTPPLFRVSKILGFFLLILWAKESFSQISPSISTVSEARMVFGIDYQDTVMNRNPIKDSSFPNELVLLAKGDQFRIEIGSSNTHSTSIGNLKTRTLENFLDFLNKKLELHFNLDTIFGNAFSRNPFTYIFTQEKKIILGYPCIKVLVHYQNPYIKDIGLYYSPEIRNFPTPYTNAFLKLPGMIMELAQNFQGIEIHFYARKIQKLSLSNEYFNFPEGYHLVEIDSFIKTAIQP